MSIATRVFCLKTLAVFLIAAMLSAAGFAQKSSDKHPVNVSIVNTPSVSVTNTPSVTVSNTPTVTVGNTPAVTVANTPNVTIANTNTQPVINSSMDEHGRIAYQSQINNTGNCTGSTCFFEFGSVPAGHRVVIQHVSGITSFTSSPNAVWIQLNNGSGSPVSTFFTPLAPSVSFSAFDQTVQAFFDPAQFGGLIEVQVGLLGSTFPAASPEVITLSGYELDCSVAPCAPIAH